jgi:Tfp pilus assembly protein PilF
MTVLTARLRAFGFRLIHAIPRPVRHALAGFLEATFMNIVRWGSAWERMRGRNQSAEAAAQRLAWYAWQRVESRDWNGARFFAKGAIAADRRHADGYRMLAYAYEGSGDATLARQACERGLQVVPDNALLVEELGSIQARAQHLPAAEALWRRAIELRGDEPHFIKRLIALLEGQRRWSEATPLLEQVQELAPTDNASLVRLGRARVNTGAFDQLRKCSVGPLRQNHLRRMRTTGWRSAWLG